MTTYIYLHGFASSPRSNKAQYLRDRFTEIGINLKIIDLNAGDFSHLTLTRQIEQTRSAFPPDNSSVTIIGSSFGGLTAAWLGEKYSQVQRLILLAPAFGFLSHWLPKLGEVQVQQWQKSGYLSVYHYGEKRELPLHYQFIADAQQYNESHLKRLLPTLILHGQNDEVIPIEASRNYINQHPWTKLIELESDHALADVMPKIWQAIYAEILPSN
ncbi:MAG: YqiA/YcfP family alpha/beta fold hydrolase [Xenococcaceae cyanobacterium MO_188.B29]|nr:YqiA/YcfP family alpha/beta fold hydrolase [Xenococcaceae cyanobacterium MO_188.B29]